MRVKFTIAICALLVLGLAVSEVAAQGYKIAVSKRAVVAGGYNQEIGKIRLTHRTQSQGDFNIREGANIEVTFGGLSLTETTAGEDATSYPRVSVTGGPSLSDISAANDKDTKAGKIKFTVSSPGSGIITISNVRVDVSALADGAEVMATVNSAAPDSDDNFDDISSAPSGATATFKVSDVMDGLNVTAVGQVSVLNCDKGVTTGRMPSITVEEGFATAWETNAGAFIADAEGAVSNSTHIRIVVANVPTGVSFRWPGDNRPKWNPASTENDVPAQIDGTNNPNYMKAPDHSAARGTDDTETVVASLLFVSDGDAIGDDKTKRFAVYQFEGSDDGGTLKDHDDFKNSFKISPRVTVDTSKTGMGGVSDAWAQLWPAAKTGDNDDRATKLTYMHETETKDEGYFVNVTECVTYLLYPFLTCGAQADWTTGIAVANTSKDDAAFPVNSGAVAQGGSVMIHAYPKSTYAEKMAAGNMMSSPDMLSDPISATISGNLAAGDTVALTCNAHAGLAGFEGYAIVRAAFRHAHGMAFVLGNFQDGAAIDVAHGYIALVIPDPEFGADGPQGRGADDGESLGH